MYLREVTRHGHLRWAVDVTFSGVRREILFAHELAAHDALVIAGEGRAACEAQSETLRKLRMLAWSTLHGAGELTNAEFERLEEIDAGRQAREEER